MDKKFDVQEVEITEGVIGRDVVPEEHEMGMVTIMGVFVNETVSGKLDELTFIPVNKALTGVELSISALQEAGCSVKIIKPVKIAPKSND